MIPQFSIFTNINVNNFGVAYRPSFKVSINHSTLPSRVIVNTIFVYMKKMFFLLFFFVCVCQAQIIEHGTVLVVVRNKDSVVIGADSKISLDDPHSLAIPNSILPNMEKIRIVGDMAYAIAGFYANITKNGDTTFNACAIIDSALRIKGNIFQRFENFRVKIRTPLEKEWKKVLQDNPAVNLNADPIVIVAGGTYNDTPFAILDVFQPKNWKNTSFVGKDFIQSIDTPKIFPISKAIDSTYHRFFCNALDKENLSVYEPLIIDNPIEYVRQLVKLAIRKDSADNGCPVRILCITRKGMSWIPDK
jgi:ATP-dependent protease HslVU (ClpYQ) peptidase subunit